MGSKTPGSVDEYVAALDGETRGALERLRRVIHAAAPRATETISYGMPTFKDGNLSLVGFAAFTKHCSLFPMSTSVIALLHDELRPYLAGKATLRFTTTRPLPDEVVTRIVEARLAENAERRERRPG